jgi:hypothetical protein
MVVGRKLSNLIPIKVAKVTSNNDWPLLYLPADAMRVLGLHKGVKVIIFIDPKKESLVIKKVEGPARRERGCLPPAKG